MIHPASPPTAPRWGRPAIARLGPRGSSWLCLYHVLRLALAEYAERARLLRERVSVVDFIVCHGLGLNPTALGGRDRRRTFTEGRSASGDGTEGLGLPLIGQLSRSKAFCLRSARQGCTQDLPKDGTFAPHCPCRLRGRPGWRASRLLLR
jgi:hypothetical protein